MQYVSGGTLQSVLDLVRKTPEAERSGRTLLRAVDQAVEQRGDSPPVGSALRERLAAWSWPETVCWLGARLAEALDYAHRQGMLHRDVKPANVLLTAEGSPKLADFNVSFGCKLDGANPAAFFGGSLAYMSPEQLEAFNPAHPRPPATWTAGPTCTRCASSSGSCWRAAGRSATTPWPATGAKLLARMTEQRRTGVAPRRDSRPAGRPARAGWNRCCSPASTPTRPAGRIRRRPARELELCLRPRARDLLYPPAGGWRSLVRRFAVPALILTIVLPNALGAVFNIAYNRSEIIAHVPARSRSSGTSRRRSTASPSPWASP